MNTATKPFFEQVADVQAIVDEANQQVPDWELVIEPASSHVSGIFTRFVVYATDDGGGTKDGYVMTATLEGAHRVGRRILRRIARREARVAKAQAELAAAGLKA